MALKIEYDKETFGQGDCVDHGERVTIYHQVARLKRGATVIAKRMVHFRGKNQTEIAANRDEAAIGAFKGFSEKSEPEVERTVKSQEEALAENEVFKAAIKGSKSVTEEDLKE